MDTDDGVNDFLARVKQLGAQRDREDEERTRQLEKEILAGRQARQDRRAERAKSLSPTKPSSARGSRVLDGIDLSHLRSLDSNTFDLKREDAVHDALDRLTGKFRKEDTDETVIATPIFPRQRQSDSPWQRQPELRGGDTLSPETSTHITKIENPRLESENEFRRSSVARNIETKGSPSPSDLNLPIDILLKSAEDRVAIVAAKKTTPRVPQNGTEDRPISMKQLPSSDHEPRKTAAPNFVRSHKSSPSMNSSGLPLKSKQNLFPTNSSMRFEPSSTNRDSLDDTSVRPLAMSPSQGRIDPDRKSTAANRGMGAYVQSAMLKREGSISKRWSTALPGGVSRSNTPASPGTRDAVIAIGRAPTPLSLSRDSSPTPEDPPSTQESVRRNVSRARAKSIVESLSKYSTSGIHPAVLEPPKPEATPPTTPSHLISKTFDQKRWSPTKSSWLESALKKGSDGGSPMLSKSTPALEPTVKQADNRTIVIPKPSSPPSRPVTESVSNLTSTSTALGQVTSSSKPLTDKSPTLESPKPLLPAKKRPPSVVEKPSPTGEKLVPGPKVELDFRGNLKRPQNLGNSIEKEDLPFLNVISRLRSTKTQNYKAQNVLKDNILAGKAALQALRPKPPDPMNGRHTSAQGAFKHSDNVSVNLSTLGPGTISESKPPLPIKHTISLSRRDSVTFPIHMESSSERVPTLASLLFRSPAPDDKSKDLPGMISSCGTSLDMGNECEKDKRCGNPPLVHITKTRARGPKRRKPTRIPSPNYTIPWTTPITEPSSQPSRERLSALLSSASSAQSGLEHGPPVSNMLKVLDLQTEPKSELKLEPNSPDLLNEPLHIAPSKSTGSPLSMSVIV